MGLLTCHFHSQCWDREETEYGFDVDICNSNIFILLQHAKTQLLSSTTMKTIIANLLINFFPSRHFDTFYIYYFKSGTTIDILYTRKLKIRRIKYFT